MKKPFFYLLLFSFIGCLITNSVFAQAWEAAKVTGKISSNSENVNNEVDPVFTSISMIPKSMNKVGQGISENVSGIAHGMAIVTEMVDRFMKNQYDFSLLSSHKYMVNDCLGIKASSGQFKIKFSSPSIEVTNSGHIKIKLEVNKINFSALKVRIKPRAPDFSDPNPCHFSGKFEIGGEATDVSVTFTLNLVVTVLEGSAVPCFFAFGAPISIKWNIGGLNLKPHPNALDNVAKEMVEDALNTGLDNLIYTKFIELSREVIPQYYETCEEVYNAEKIKSIANPAISGSESSGKWDMKPNKLKTSTGRLLMNNPAGSTWIVYINRMADNKHVTSANNTNNKGLFVLAPGEYKVSINNTPVQNVQIKQGHDTKLRTGVLNVPADGVWNLYDVSGKDFHTSGNKPTRLALPIGQYKLTLNNAPIENVSIADSIDTKIKTGVLDITENDVWYLYDEEGKKSYTSGNKPEKIVLPVGNYTLKVGGRDQSVMVKSISQELHTSGIEDEKYWVITALDGTISADMGRLSMYVPKDTTIFVPVMNKTLTVPLDITDMAGYAITGNWQLQNLKMPKYLTTGTYTVELNRIHVSRVPVREGKETRLKAGFLVISEKKTEGEPGESDLEQVLDVMYGSNDFPDKAWTWSIRLGGYEFTGKKIKIFALPPGEYTVVKTHPDGYSKKIIYKAVIKDGEWAINGVKKEAND